jgi:LmbE family N-acetylglucosaminyl deacetylase
MKLLAIVAHPDDESIFCGGTLAKHSERGDAVTVGFLTDGAYGGATEVDDLAAIRRSEAKTATSRLGARATFLDFADGHLEATVDNRFEIVEFIRSEDPDIIITHHADDLHPDHRAASRLVRDAYTLASLPRVDTESPPCNPENVYFFGKPTSDFDPSIRIDTSDYQDTKERAIQAHSSQFEWLENHGGVDAEFESLIEDVRARARVRGNECGVPFAEGFESLQDTATAYLGEQPE